jgi:hypothetical protein
MRAKGARTSRRGGRKTARKPPRKQIIVRFLVPGGMREAVERVAASRETTMAGIVREALVQYLVQSENRAGVPLPGPAEGDFRDPRHSTTAP